MRADAYSHSGHVIQRLWRREPRDEAPEVSLLLDAARDPRLPSLIRRSRLDHRCLLRGRLPRVLAAVAPYLVSLSPRSAFTTTVIEQGWGESWGLFLRSQSILPELARHFRELLLVKDERGRELFFRFYDPRVLRLYLPTCTPAELRTFFGPVDAFAFEGQEEDTMVELSRVKDSLVTRIVYVGR
jgi:Domain of unknown function (DUF4123)